VARHEIPGLRQDYQDSGIIIQKYNECSRRVDGGLSNWFPTVVGLLQGAVLSPLLFNIFLEIVVM